MEKCRRFVGGTHAVLALLALVTAIEALRAAAAEGTESTTLSDFSNDLQRSCPLAMPDVYSKVAPAGKLHANYTKVDGPANFDQCFKACCEDKGCNAAFMYLNESTFICYKTLCFTDEDCLPSPNEQTTHMVLVRPYGHASWKKVPGYRALSPASSSPDAAPPPAGSTTTAALSSISTTTTPSAPNAFTPVPCEVGLEREACGENEDCVSPNSRSRNGVCRCRKGFERWQQDGRCHKKKVVPGSTTSTPMSTSTTTPTVPPPKRLTVSVMSKNLTLPENSAELIAYAVPESPAGTSYEYEWSLLSSTSQSPAADGAGGGTAPVKGTMQGGNKQKLTVTDLVEGIYEFKVVVTGKDPVAEGEGYGNVTVLPPKRVNKPPTAVLHPETQNIQLPTHSAVVDASQSFDDYTKELTYKWELVVGPLGYTGSFDETEPTITLTDLIAGNYTVKVTVSDEEGASDERLATIVVHEMNDYPPTANAGEDLIIHLPQNEVVLNGNRSSDDHGIVSWEWRAKPPEKGMKELAADTQNMRTVQPTISNLEEGTYTFILKVTDIKGQSSEDEVNVYVKPPVNQPPKADAGEDKEISLPTTWILLDGSASKDEVSVTDYVWTQVSGPNDAALINGTGVRANATGLTKGHYAFKLTVKNGQGNSASDVVEVTVTQDQNEAPVAVAGGDYAVALPVNTVVFNGSQSHDDYRVVRWAWTRLASSPAAGRVVGDTHTRPVLYVTDVVAGQYAFQLEVFDDQGKSDTDVATVTVKANPDARNVIRAVFNQDLETMSVTRLDEIVSTLSLLLHGGGKYRIEVLKLFQERDTNNAVMDFYVVQTDPTSPLESPMVAAAVASGADATVDKVALHDVASKHHKVDVPNLPLSHNIASGKKVVDMLWAKLRKDADLLSLKILTLDTVICQNDCSGHGTCHQATRMCICDAFWMENPIRSRWTDGRRNCDWSIIYVGSMISILGMVVVGTSCYYSCKKKHGSFSRGISVMANGHGMRGAANGGPKARRAGSAKYSRLNTEDDHLELRNAYTSSLMLSESESDDEITFGGGGGSTAASNFVSVAIPNGRGVGGGGSSVIESSSETSGIAVKRTNGTASSRSTMNA